MRIAVVTTSYPSSPGDPAGHFVRAEVRELERAGHDVLVVAPPADESRSAFGWPGVAARVRARPWRALSAARWVRDATRAIARAPDIDRIVCHWAVPSAWPIGYAGGAPIEVVSHGGDVRLLVALPRALRGAIVRRIVARAERWRFVAAHLADTLCGSLDRDLAVRVRAIATIAPSPLEMPDVARAAAERAPGPGEPPLYVSVGRLVASKCVDRAIDHVAEHAPGAHLVVVGDGPLRARLEAHAKRRGVEARFVGVVPREEALAWISAADALVHASRTEGHSTVVREAESLGVRIVRA